MFNFLKKEEVQESIPITSNDDWTKDIKRSKRIGQEVEQLSFLYDSESNNEVLGTKKGLSKDHLTILIKCKEESTAVELMKILNRTNRTKFKHAIIEPLIDHSFLERTIPDSPKSPSQKYRLTGKFIRRRSRNLILE